MEGFVDLGGTETGSLVSDLRDTRRLLRLRFTSPPFVLMGVIFCVLPSVLLSKTHHLLSHCENFTVLNN